MGDKERRDRDRDREREREGKREGGEGTARQGGRSAPRDAHCVAAMLKEMGVHEHDPRVVCQLLEFAHRYVGGVLEDARAFAQHAKKKSLEAEDVRLAAAARLERAFTQPPPREILLELTKHKNAAPLPLVKPHCGLRLPPDRYCLSQCNYALVKKPPPQHSRPVAKPQPFNQQPKRPPYAAHQRLITKMDVDSDRRPLKRERIDDDYDNL